MLYSALLKLHILLIAVPGIYGGVGADALHHPLIVHVAYLTQQSREFSVTGRTGASDNSSYSKHRVDNSSFHKPSSVVIPTGTVRCTASEVTSGDFAEVVRVTLSPRAP